MTAEGQEENKEGRPLMDKVCDPCGLVPDNLEEALAHRKQMKLAKAEEKEAAALAAAEANPNAPEDETYFNIDCCGKANTSADEIQVQEFPAEKLLEDEEQPNEEIPEEEMLKDGENADDKSQQTQSLAEIAAKMEEIDLETAAEDIAGDQMSEDGAGSIKKLGDFQPWYREPLYAGLIALCASFSIAILVMIILLAKN
jgi:hypothetical protein